MIMYILFVRASKEKSDHLICRETFAAAKASIWNKTMTDTLAMAFPHLNPHFNYSDYICTLSNGSTIRVAGLDDNKKVERLLGNEYSTLWFNEANQIPYPAITKLKTRLAQKNGLKKLSFYDLNPGKTSSWVYQLFEDKCDPIDGENLDNPEDYLSIKMNIGANLDNVDPAYLKLLQKMPKLERMRFLDGEYDDSNMGKAVYAFDADKHISEQAKKLPGTIFTGTDFNIDYNSDVIASIYGNPAKLYTCGVYVWDEVQLAGDTYKKADELKRKCPGATIVADSTGKNRRTAGKSDFIILDDAGFTLEKTHNPLVRDKIANLNRCFTLDLIKIHPRCKKLIRDLKQLKWNKHGELDQKTDPSLSHLVDCLAYLCWAKFPIMDSGMGGIRTRS